MKFVSAYNTTSSQKVIDMVETMGPSAAHMQTFWILLAAQLNSTTLETLINGLLTRDIRDDAASSDAANHRFASLKFPMNFHQFLCEILSLSDMHRFAEHLLRGVMYQGSGAQYVQNRVQRDAASCDGSFLRALFDIWCEETDDANESALVRASESFDGSLAESCKEVVCCCSEMISSSCSLPLDIVRLDYTLQKDDFFNRKSFAFPCFAEHAIHKDGGVIRVPTLVSFLIGFRCSYSYCPAGDWVQSSTDPCDGHGHQAPRRRREGCSVTAFQARRAMSGTTIIIELQ